MNKEKETVLITGISGWIAQYCAIELIKAGYHVRGSLRSMDRQQEVIDALSKEVDPTKALEFCKLDLLKDDGWDEAMAGCTYAMHIASPFYIKEPKDESELIKPAKDGTLRAMNAAKKAKLKRIVVTSSVVAMSAHLKEGVATPDTWTDINQQVNTYQRSKTITEKAAWEFIKNQKGDHQLELTVVNPGGVMGPALSDNLDCESLSICTKLMTGKMPGIPNFSIVMVDVRDVAMHHLQAMTLPEANNKRIMSCLRKPTPFIELATILKDAGFKVPTNKVPTLLLKFLALFDREAKGMLPLLERQVECDNSETIELFNWTPRPLKETFIDMAKSIQSVLDMQKK
jgi:dihydroflavonol-4-reductase